MVLLAFSLWADVASGRVAHRIDLIAGLIVVIAGRPACPALLLGVVGAWVGFVVEAMIGLTIDVVGSGIYLAIVRHLIAVVCTVVALARFRIP